MNTAAILNAPLNLLDDLDRVVGPGMCPGRNFARTHRSRDRQFLCLAGQLLRLDKAGYDSHLALKRSFCGGVADVEAVGPIGVGGPTHRGRQAVAAWRASCRSCASSDGKQNISD